MRLMAIGLAAGLMLGGVASANVAPPPDLPNRMAAEAVEAFMENFNAGSVEGIESVLANRTDFVWPENGVLRNEGETATVADIKAALEAQPGLRLETTGLKVILLDRGVDTALSTWALISSMRRAAPRTASTVIRSPRNHRPVRPVS